MGNTCYLSALMQCLASAIPECCFQPGASSHPLFLLFVQAIKDLLTHSTTPLHLGPLWQELTRRQPSLAGPLQQDLFEAWHHLAALGPLRGLFSISKKLLTRCGLGAEGCGFSAESLDRTHVWSMPLPPEGRERENWWEGTLGDQLTQVHQLPTWICPCCGSIGATQRVTDLSAPPCLWLQVHRFEIGPQGPHKLHQPFPIPRGSLQLAPLHHGVPLPPAHYQLVGVVLHQGDFAGGHYRALALRQLMWFSFDDSFTACVGAVIPPNQEHLVDGLLFRQSVLPLGVIGAPGSPGLAPSELLSDLPSSPSGCD